MNLLIASHNENFKYFFPEAEIIPPELPVVIAFLQKNTYSILLFDSDLLPHYKSIDTIKSTLSYTLFLVGYTFLEADFTIGKNDYFLSPSIYSFIELQHQIKLIQDRHDNRYTKPDKVLIIEDNKDILEMYKLAFQAENIQVYTALNGLEGISLCSIIKPDVILLDIMMPQMDGFEVLKAIRNNTSLLTKIIVCSNLEQLKDEEKAKNLGADMFLKKTSYTPFEVVNIVMGDK